MKSNLQALRKKAGYKSAVAYAEHIGINPKTYTNYEQGTSPMSVDTAWTIADDLGCTLDELVGREWPEPESDLTAQESRVLDAYRDADVIERRIIERAAGIDSGGAVAQSDQGVGIA